MPSHVRIRRAIRLAPLFDYMLHHGIRVKFIGDSLGLQRSRTYQIQSGMCPTPERFIEDACQVISVPATNIYPDWPHIDEVFPPKDATSDTAA
jgi:hypothetical protein